MLHWSWRSLLCCQPILWAFICNPHQVMIVCTRIFFYCLFCFYVCSITMLAACLWIDIRMFWDIVLSLTLTNGLFIPSLGCRLCPFFNESPLIKKNYLCYFWKKTTTGTTHRQGFKKGYEIKIVPAI